MAKPKPCPCGARYGTVTLECVACCVKLLLPLCTDGQRINAGVIRAATSAEHMQAVREAFKLEIGSGTRAA